MLRGATRDTRGAGDGVRSRSYLSGDEPIRVTNIKAVQDKVDRVLYHPVAPWVAYVTRENVVGVWDYDADQLIYTNHFGGADEAALQIQALETRAANVLPSASGSSARGPAVLGATAGASGDVKAVLFLDADVIYWTLARQMSQREGSFDGSDMPTLDTARRLLGSRRWLVVACENKLIAHDLASPDVVEMPKAQFFEGRTPTSLALLLSNSRGLLRDLADKQSRGSSVEIMPLLAVGTSHGATFIVSLESARPHAKLGGGAHKGAIHALLTLPGRSRGAPDRLLSAGADGNVAVWDPSNTPGRGTEVEVSPATQWKAHDGPARDLEYFALPGSGAGDVVFALASVGDDGAVCIWDGLSFKQRLRAHPLGKVGFNTVRLLAGGEATVGAGPCLVLTSLESTQLVGFNPSAGTSATLADVQDSLDPGMKKAPKIYSAAVHPVRAHMLAIATNTGVAMLSSDSSFLPSVVAIPSSVMHVDATKDEATAGGVGDLATAPARPAGAAKGAQGYTYLSALGGSLVASSVRMETKRIEGRAELGVTLSHEGVPAVVAELEHTGAPVLSTSPSGRTLALLWPESHVYVVYTFNAQSGAWEAIDRGSATQLAWSSTSATYATLVPPQVEVTRVKQRKGLGFLRARKDKGGKDEVAHVVGPATLATHVVDEEGGTHSLVSEDTGSGADARALHGGALLGVVGARGDGDGALQFYSWASLSPVGPELPEPLWIAWEPECTQAALAYHQSVELCRVHPKFERFATLAVANSTSGLWQSRQLVVATPTSLHVAFADPAEGFVQSLTLASLAGTSLASVLAQSDEGGALPVQQLRPPGPVVLCGIRHSYLWLADHLGRPFLISLRHPGVRVRCLAARGELASARAVADRGFSPAFHDEVSNFLVAMGGDEGVRESLRLSGLTPRAEFYLCSQIGEWDRAASAFQIAALGVEDRGLLGLALQTMAATTDAAPSKLSRSPEADADAAAEEEDDERPDLVAQILEEATKADHSTPFEAAPPKGSEASSDSEDEEESKIAVVDWEAALVAGGPEGAAVGPRVGTGAVAGIDPSFAVAVARQGLSFADAAVQAGQADAARAVLGVLVLMAGDLPTPLLEDLVFKLGICSMTESARALAEAVAGSGGAALRDPAVAAPLAALIGGKDGAGVRRTLQAARLAPLAAVYGAVWGGTDLDPLLDDWASLAGGGTVAVSPPEA